jgi:hypothetical protein
VDTGKTQRSEGWQGASVGAVSAKMGLVFVLARKRRLDLVTVRAVAERRPPERNGVKERRGANRWVFDFNEERNFDPVWHEIGARPKERASPGRRASTRKRPQWRKAAQLPYRDWILD